MLTLNKKGEFYNRLWVSAIAISIVAFLVGFAYHPWAKVLLVLACATLTAIGVWEYAQLAKAKGINPATSLMMGVAVLEVLAFYISLAYPQWSKLALMIIVLGFISFFVVRFRSPENALLNVAAEFFGVCYLAIPFSFILAILYPRPEFVDGRLWLFYLIAVTKITDVGGYFVGKLFGKHPLAPHLSPRKTVEGAIGGFCFAVILSLIFCSIGKAFGSELSFFHAAWLGMIIGILGQVGDLAESLLKRDAAVKDSNKIPGIGGVLDLLDSVLFTSPVVYFFIRTLL
ncbi:MAG: phosphatidate cytidylyltransferase [Verrucomicrobia bacterium]|nr:phosphatidate cytidylyltransferase [Verrucomicrobiota bacterium]